MTPTQRNRLIKKTLIEPFGRGNVRVYQDTAPLKDWIIIEINERPRDADDHRRMEAQTWAWLKDARLDKRIGDKVSIRFLPYEGEAVTVQLTGMEDIISEERDRIEQAIADDPLWAAEELLEIKRALERIASSHENWVSAIAHEALQSKLWSGER